MRKVRLLSVMLAVMLLTGCFAFTHKIKPISEMTPREKANTALATYNKMFDAYQEKAALPDLSAAEKQTLKTQWQVLNKAWPIIDAYDKSVSGTGPPLDVVGLQFIDNFLATYRY